jgi:hypothetical protein
LASRFIKTLQLLPRPHDHASSHEINSLLPTTIVLNDRLLATSTDLKIEDDEISRGVQVYDMNLGEKVREWVVSEREYDQHAQRDFQTWEHSQIYLVGPHPSFPPHTISTLQLRATFEERTEFYGFDEQGDDHVVEVQEWNFMTGKHVSSCETRLEKIDASCRLARTFLLSNGDLMYVSHPLPLRFLFLP